MTVCWTQQSPHHRMWGVEADDEVDWLIAWLQDRPMESTPRPVYLGDVGPAYPDALDSTGAVLAAVAGTDTEKTIRHRAYGILNRCAAGGPERCSQRHGSGEPDACLDAGRAS